MDSSKYIGRVGALAVALGIGTALTTGTGVAWADDGSGSGSATKTTSSSTESKSDTSDAKKTKRKDPLSKIGERVRKDLKAGLDGVNDTVKRAQSRLDKPRTQITGGISKAKTRDKDATDSTDEAVAQRTERTGRTTKTSSARARLTPDAVDTVPELRRPTANVVVKVKEAAEKLTENLEPKSRETVPAAATSSTASGPKTTAPAIAPAIEKALENVAEQVTETVTEVAAPPKLTARPVLSTLLAATGLSPLAAETNPTAPPPSPGLWAVMAWARRESERALNPTGTSLVSAKDAASVVAEGEVVPTAAVTPNIAVQTDDLTPKPEVPASLAGQTIPLPWVTGTGATDHWYVAGTDLGIMWNSGYIDENTGKPVIYTLFGDTYSGAGMTGDWRNNVLFRTSDTDLSNGLQFSDALIHAGANANNAGTPTWYGTGGAAAGAAQIIYDPGYNGLFGTTYTMIPTSGIALKNPDGQGGYTQYATVMSVRTWDNPGSWTTNYSAIAYSNDGGKTWKVDPDTVRSSGWLRSSTSYVPGDEHFQQNALVTSDDPNDPYVYVYGTPSGRQGSAYLARVEKDDITNLDAYEYWSGEDSSGNGKWVTGDPSSAVPVFGSSQNDFLPKLYKFIDTFTFGFFSKIANGIWVGGLPTNGNVSEMSVQYNEYLGKYVVLYTDGGNNVVMRVSDSPQGEWSDTTTLVNNNPLSSNTGMYAPMVHPMSGTDYFNTTDDDGNVVDNSQYLYYNLSYWDAYNVRLMRTDLSTMKTVSV